MKQSICYQQISSWEMWQELNEGKDSEDLTYQNTASLMYPEVCMTAESPKVCIMKCATQDPIYIVLSRHCLLWSA